MSEKEKFIQLTPEQYISIGVGKHVLIGDCVVSLVRPSPFPELQKVANRLGLRLEPNGS